MVRLHERPQSMKEKEKKFLHGIGYAQVDLVSGLEWARTELDGLRKDLQQTSDPVAQDAASQTILLYERAVLYGDKHTPVEMMKTLQQIFNRGQELERSGKEQIEIGKMMSQEFGEQISDLRVILRQKSGWIKSLGQWAYAARLK